MNRTTHLLGIGLAAGFFSALFGVGGGIVVVPLLVLALGFRERPAMATSLAAIFVIALVGAVTYALHGEVRAEYAAVLGIPAAFGAVGGAALQQRLTTRWLTLSFAALLAGVGVLLLIDA